MRKLFALLGICGSLGLSAQILGGVDWERTVYNDEFSVGIMLHTASPWPGFNFRRLHYTDGFNRWGYEIDYSAFRHPREIRFPAQTFLAASQSMTYGKINDFFAFRFGYGRAKVLYDKQDRGSLSISLMTFGGVSLGFLKPIYVKVEGYDDSGAKYSYVERYDPEIHDNLSITEESFFTGFAETNLRPGIYAKVGASFDYNFFDQKITALEVGTILDYYPSWFGLYEEGVPVMAQVSNPSLWWQIYISFNFGNKWY